ncbi:hypothetical protein Taro_055645 [Colocasia esculenta]|uniref:Uncharacterized protein n=1 Tax=Colocasia esculenta TaxID=4460 RepID=A0A843XU99_COLES|nr:hypothetical protein [Colocasia esculenta]
MAADYWLAASPLDVDQSWRPHPWTSACGWRPDPWMSIGNIVNVTVELSSFGRPKEEKLKPHLLNLVNRGVNEVNQQPIIANERPATFASLRRTPTVDTGTNGGGETDRPQPLFWRSRWDQQCCHGYSLHPGRWQAVLPPTQSSVTGGSFLSSVLASPHILGQPFFGLQPFTRGFPLG